MEFGGWFSGRGGRVYGLARGKLCGVQFRRLAFCLNWSVSYLGIHYWVFGALGGFGGF